MKTTAAQFWKAPALFAGMLLLLAPAAVAQTAADTARPAASKKNRWTPEDVVYQEDAGQFRISPDGKSAVWVKNMADKEKDLRVSNLYLSNLNDGKEVQLTRGTDEVSQPRWSPSGRHDCFPEHSCAAQAEARRRAHSIVAVEFRGRRALGGDGY